MITLVIGGSKSGKSKYAEGLVSRIAKKNNYTKYYLATMIPFDDEDSLRIKKHQENRINANFITIEEAYEINKIKLDNNSIILLESITSYLLNKIFILDENLINIESDLEIIANEFKTFYSNNKNVVLVGDYIFSNIESLTSKFSNFTLNYLELFGKLLQIIASDADNVIEVKMGIIKRIKGELLWTKKRKKVSYLYL